MSKSINAAVLGLVLFLLAYCVCFWFGVMPKFYPTRGAVTTAVLKSPVTGKAEIAVKFVGSAVVGMAAGAIGRLIGKRLRRPAAWLHLAMWAAMLAACVYLVGRETVEYILH